MPEVYDLRITYRLLLCNHKPSTKHPVGICMTTCLFSCVGSNEEVQKNKINNNSLRRMLIYPFHNDCHPVTRTMMWVFAYPGITSS